MDKMDRLFGLGFLVGICFGAYIFFFIGHAAGKFDITRTWQVDTAKHSCAAFDPKTGEWGWIKQGD